MNSDKGLRSQALSSVFWGVAQSWGGKLILFGLFLVLARILTPLEFGLVSAAVSIMLIVTQVADFGFGDAIVQRGEVLDEDLNLPFFFSICFAAIVSFALFIWAEDVGSYLNVQGVAPVLRVMSLIGPLTIFSQIQETVLRKKLEYKKLAIRVFVANSVSGVVAVFLALMGGGVWSLVVQSVGGVLISSIWLWRRPVWRPSLDFNWKSFFELKRYARNVVGNRVLDILATRAVELMILSYFGPAVLGLYSAGTRIFMTLMQLFQGALSDVALSLLSRISHDRDRTAGVYSKTSTLSTLVVSPIFVCLAVVAVELGNIMFGKKWGGVEDVLKPLLLVGAIQCVQLINSTYLNACGRPGLVLLMGAVKAPSILVTLYFVRGLDVGGLMSAYAIAQLVTTPISFYLVFKVLGVDWKKIFVQLFPIALCLVGAFYGASEVRLAILDDVKNDVLRACVGGSAFFIIYLLAVFCCARKQAQIVAESFLYRFKKS